MTETKQNDFLQKKRRTKKNNGLKNGKEKNDSMMGHESTVDRISPDDCWWGGGGRI